MQVLLINANYAPLAVVTLPRAMRLLARQKAEVLETDSRAITTWIGWIAWRATGSSQPRVLAAAQLA
jgi:hypothetical protein